MTTEWRETVDCPQCGLTFSSEQPIKAWIRQHRDLDSRQACLCIGDSDLWVQKYGTRLGRRGVDRSVMYLMLVEMRTNGRNLKPDDPHRELLTIVNVLLRTNRWKETRDHGRFVAGHKQNARPVSVVIRGRLTPIHCYGVHLLRLSGPTPDLSEWITWDHKKITKDQLLSLLRYDLHPDSLNRMEHRSHKAVVDMPALFGVADLVRPTGIVTA